VYTLIEQGVKLQALKVIYLSIVIYTSIPYLKEWEHQSRKLLAVVNLILLLESPDTCRGLANRAGVTAASGVAGTEAETAGFVAGTEGETAGFVVGTESETTAGDANSSVTSMISSSGVDSGAAAGAESSSGSSVMHGGRTTIQLGCGRGSKVRDLEGLLNSCISILVVMPRE